MRTTVTVGAQARDALGMRWSRLENNTAKIVSLLLHVPVYLLLDKAQVCDRPAVWTLVTIGVHTRDKPDVRRSAM